MGKPLKKPYAIKGTKQISINRDCTSINASVHDVSNFILAIQLLPKTTTHSYPYQLASHSWPLFLWTACLWHVVHGKEAASYSVSTN